MSHRGYHHRRHYYDNNSALEVSNPFFVQYFVYFFLFLVDFAIASVKLMKYVSKIFALISVDVYSNNFCYIGTLFVYTHVFVYTCFSILT